MDRDDRQEHDREAREERRLRALEDVDPAPQQQIFARQQQAGKVRAEETDLANRALQPVGVAQDRLVAQEERREQQAAGHEGGADDDEAPRRPSADCEPGEPERNQYGQKEEVVAARQRLQEPGRGRGEGPARASGAIVAVQRPEADRRPVRRQCLDVRHLRQTIGRECERHRGHDGHVVPPRDRVREEVRPQRAQHERGDECDVVADERLVCQRDEWRRDRRQPQQVLRKRKDSWRRVERRSIPPVRGQRDRLRARPPQDPGVQQRIAKVVRDAGR